MADMLNLDDFAKERRVLKLKGETHEMKEATVDDFIEITEMSGKLEESQSFSDQLKFTIALIHKRFPTVSTEQLGGLSFEQLNAVLEFTNATNIAEEVAKEDEVKEGGESAQGKTAG